MESLGYPGVGGPGLGSLEESPQAVRDSALGSIPEGSVGLGLSDLAPGLRGAQRGCELGHKCPLCTGHDHALKTRVCSTASAGQRAVRGSRALRAPETAASAPPIQSGAPARGTGGGAAAGRPVGPEPFGQNHGTLSHPGQEPISAADTKRGIFWGQ